MRLKLFLSCFISNSSRNSTLIQSLVLFLFSWRKWKIVSSRLQSRHSVGMRQHGTAAILHDVVSHCICNARSLSCSCYNDSRQLNPKFILFWALARMPNSFLRYLCDIIYDYDASSRRWLCLCILEHSAAVNHLRAILHSATKHNK